MLRTILLFYPDWLKPSVCKTEYTIVSIRIRLPILFFFPPFLLCSDSEGKPTALEFPARWERALPGGLQLQGILQSPAVFLASDLRHPDFLPTQLCWQETRQSSPGLLCWFCWSYWKINDLWVIYRFGQVGKLKLEKLPGVFCLKASQVLFQRELCWGAGCPVIA